MIASFLEDFGPVALVPDLASEAEAAAEEQRLAVFEQGYAAGWDDAIKAQADNSNIATETFAKNLGDLAFTYHEAASNLAAALVPFLAKITEQIVPAGLEASAVAMIAEELCQSAQNAGRIPVEVTCSPFREAMLVDSLPSGLAMPIKISSDASMNRDEVSLRFGDIERQIDLSDIAAQIETAIAAFSFQVQKDLSHG